MYTKPKLYIKFKIDTKNKIYTKSKIHTKSKMYTKINIYDEMINIRKGVIQGGILSPKLFNIFYDTLLD